MDIINYLTQIFLFFRNFLMENMTTQCYLYQTLREFTLIELGRSNAKFEIFLPRY